MPIVQVNTAANPAYIDIPSTPPVGNVGVPVIYVDGFAQHINHGNYWFPGGTALTNTMRWEAIGQGDPWNPSGYIIADGYGGSHALLFSGTSGNITFFDGVIQQIVTFGGDDTPPPGVFSHVQVAITPDAFGNSWIGVWVNGVPIGQTIVPGGASPWTRVTAGIGSGTLYIGGSSHSNYKGYIAQIRGYDNVAAIDIAWNQAFIPQRFFGGQDINAVPCTFLASYMNPLLGITPDLSAGYDSNGGFTTKTQHPGYPYNVTGLAQIDQGEQGNQPPSAYPLPSIRYVQNAPFDANYIETPPSRGFTPTPPPPGCKLFDSFSRPDQTYFHSAAPDIGSIEFSSFGPVQAWRTAYPGNQPPFTPQYVMLFNRSPIWIANEPVWMYVQNDSPDMDVRGTRRNTVGTSSDGQIGLAFRVQDDNNGWAGIYINIIGNNGVLLASEFRLFTIIAGIANLVASAPIAANDPWQILSVTTVGNTITLYADGVQQIQVIDPTFNTALGCGISSGISAGTPSSLARCFDWTVF